MERKYSFLEKIIAAYSHQSPEYFYASKVEKLAMEFQWLEEHEKVEFLKLIEINKNK